MRTLMLGSRMPMYLSFPLGTEPPRCASSDSRRRQKTTIVLPSDDGPETDDETDKEKDPTKNDPVQHPETGELTDNPFLDSDDDEAYTAAHQPPTAAATPKPTTPPKEEAETVEDIPIPKKAP
jgi:hypothetical protein